jgi:hypothetical protein
MLDRPEFEDLGRMRALFKTFEEKGRLVRILNACLSDGLRVFIGHEVPDPELQDLSLVTASYAVDGEKGWGLGVLGSTRMEYGRIVSVVDHVARVVAQARVVGIKVVGEKTGIVDETIFDQQRQGDIAVIPRRGAITLGTPAGQLFQCGQSTLQAGSLLGGSLGAGVLVPVAVVAYLVSGLQDGDHLFWK